MRKLLIILLFVGTGICIAQDKKAAPTYKPSEIQLLRLQVKQKDAQLAFLAVQQAQATFNQRIQDLTSEADKIKLENGWDAKVTFDGNTLIFAEPEKKP